MVIQGIPYWLVLIQNDCLIGMLAKLCIALRKTFCVIIGPVLAGNKHPDVHCRRIFEQLQNARHSLDRIANSSQ